VAAALVAWLLAFIDAPLRAQVGGALLAGVAGPSYFTGRLPIQNLREAASEASDAAADAAGALAEQTNDDGE
jgi:hypothetical protein